MGRIEAKTPGDFERTSIIRQAGPAVGAGNVEEPAEKLFEDRAIVGK
jgi:hypothetical protein